MNVDEALRQLGEAEGLPREALQWSLDHWDEASPRLLAKLRALVNHPDPFDRSDDELAAVFMIIHLCAEKRDSRAYAPLCRLIAADSDFDMWFDVGVDETLSGVLINLFDGDVGPLKEAIESVGAGQYSRASALQALAYLSRSRSALSEEEMRAYLVTLRKEMAPREESEIWIGWALAVARLGHESLRGEVGRLFSAGWIDRDSLDLEAFHAVLGISRNDQDGLAAFREDGIGPFGSTIETFAEAWSGDGEGDDLEEDEFELEKGYVDGFRPGDVEKPFVNPVRDVGRNDPCPCGSGKKYKKCCLAA